MNKHYVLSGALFLGFIATIAIAIAQEVKTDVPFVPTPQSVVDKMLELAAPKEGETLYDLGCGNGIIIVTAAKKYKVKGIGVDIDPQRIKECVENAEKNGVTDQVKFINKDLFTMDFSDADVLAMYLLTSVNAKLRPKILADMKPGSRVVSHAFDMGDWKPDKTVEVKDPESSYSRTVHFWIVPARVEGSHEVLLKTPQGDERAALTLKQNFQDVTGTAKVGDKEVQITDGKLRGNELSFTAEGQKYSATIKTKEDDKQKKAA